MNDKVQKQINGIKAQTIGVEVEMNSITRKNAAMLAAGFFGTNNWKYTGHINGYQTWSAWDTQSREWKFMKDISIDSDDEEKKCELVTPILHYEDIETLQGLVRVLRKAGAKSHAGIGCGVHIHIGAQGHTPQTLRNLANLMASHENLISDAIKMSEQRKAVYCQVTNPKFITELNKKKPQSMEQLAKIWYETHDATFGANQHYNKSRYHMLNLHATFTKGTVEFRLFQFDKPEGDKKNGIHAGQLKAYIQLCLAMSEAAKELKTISPKEPQHENPKFAMRTWLNRMGMIGEEFSTAREFLTKNLDGNAAWRHAV